MRTINNPILPEILATTNIFFNDKGARFYWNLMLINAITFKIIKNASTPKRGNS
jgi:hypothetical protein